MLWHELRCAKLAPAWDNLLIDTTKTGWSLMTYQGQSLGWAKLLPNRVNNYYPKELRILSSFQSAKEEGI